MNTKLENLNSNQSDEIEKQFHARTESFMITTTEKQAWELFNSIKESYKAKTPNDIIDKWRMMEIKIDDDIISTLLLIA